MGQAGEWGDVDVGDVVECKGHRSWLGVIVEKRAIPPTLPPMHDFGDCHLVIRWLQSDTPSPVLYRPYYFRRASAVAVLAALRIEHDDAV